MRGPRPPRPSGVLPHPVATGSGRSSAASPRQAVSIVMFAPRASPTARPGRSRSGRDDRGQQLLGLGPGEQDADRDHRDAQPPRGPGGVADEQLGAAEQQHGCTGDQQPARHGAPAKRWHDVGRPASRSRRAGPAATAAAPRATSSAPSAATIAPLSVHSPGRGTRSAMPAVVAALLGQRPQPGVGRDAAADQQVVDALLACRPATALRVSTSTTASWKDAATSATGTGSPARSRPRPSGPPRSSARRRRSRSGARAGRAARSGRAGTSTSPGRRSRAARSMCGPPGKRQAQHPRHLVERLARGVVDGRAERLARRAGDVAHQQQRRVAAGHQQRHARLRAAGRARAGRPRRGRRGG